MPVILFPPTLMLYLGHSQSIGADASSSFLYTRWEHFVIASYIHSCDYQSTRRSKGLTEQGLASIGFDDVIIFRPAFLAQADREAFRPVEWAVS